ncbi:MAG TPA: hypothetical protein VH475_29075 [Tepidisphaeraceae bacterium]|jgi:hypothetical protein
MSVRHAAQARWFAAGLILLLVGCGPTRTSGTSGLAAGELALFSIAQLPKESPLQIHTIQFDGGGEEYEVGEGRDFYLMPRDHTASFTLEAIVPKEAGLLGSLVPKDARIIPGPRNIPLGAMSAGKAYELAPPAQGFDKLLETGQFSLVREKERAK